MDIMCPSKMSSGDGASVVINIRVINSWKKKTFPVLQVTKIRANTKTVLGLLSIR